MRPKKLASRNVGLFEVYKYVYKKYKEQKLIFHEVWALLPCTPLIDYLDLLKLKSLIDKNKLNKPVISVSKYNAPIEWAFTLNKKIKCYLLNIKKNNKYHLKI